MSDNLSTTLFESHKPHYKLHVYIDSDVRFADEKDMKKINKQLLNFNTLFRPGVYRKMQRDRDKDVR